MADWLENADWRLAGGRAAGGWLVRLVCLWPRASRGRAEVIREDRRVGCTRGGMSCSECVMICNLVMRSLRLGAGCWQAGVW